MTRPDNADAIMNWRAQGVSMAEIGHRLGVSPERLREIMAAAGVPEDQLGSSVQDDDGPNTAEVR